MKSFISLALLGLAAAGPVQRRGMTEVVVTTEWTTTTVYVSPATGAAFAEGAKSSSPIPSLPASSAPAAPSVPVPEPTPTPSPAPAPAAPSPAPAVPVAAAAPAPNAGSGASTLKSGTGQGTYYDVTVGLGSCGLAQAGPNDPVVALALGTMNNGANSNKNPLCGKAIYITYQGAAHRGMVYDSCAGCAAGDVDFSDGFFKQVMPHGDGRVDGVSWVIKDEPF